MLHVKSVNRSLDFYTRMGFEVGNTFTPPGQAEPTWAWLQSGRAQIMVTRAAAPASPPPEVVTLYFYTPDVAAYRAGLIAQGIAAGQVTTPAYAPRGEFLVTDPDGFTLMVSHT